LLFGAVEVTDAMLLTLAIILLIAWALGLFAFKVTAWFIHVLIVVAIIVAILHFVRGRPAV
jgi:endonuclease/exonuclease/phosphatase (EEP) superfamily protein YafD